MIQGTASSAGKSLVTTALARAFARRGLDVVPFKAQNMSNNARVVDGGEIGVAQYLQALAAGIEPDVRMNPVLVKPEGDNRSQVIVLGEPDLELSRLPWRERSAALWPPIEEALQSLLAEHELVLLEGAGSPAEINLRDTDLANMRSARSAEAVVVMVADIDRGGAFAHLYGTWALLPPEERELICGFVLNKFRGDRALLPPAPAKLEELTGVPTLGVLPWLQHGLPDEDGAAPPQRRPGARSVSVIRYPTASNLDEFRPLEQVADVVWATTAQQLTNADLVVLPGSKHVASDLAWLRRTGLASAVTERFHAGRSVLGICGGLQILGSCIADPAGVDGDAVGLNVLPVTTVFARTKLTRRVETRFRALPPPWNPLGGIDVRGYEIRHGETRAKEPGLDATADGLGFVRGPVLGVSFHGLFENDAVVEAFFGRRADRSLEAVFDELADAVEEHLDLPQLEALAGIAGAAPLVRR